MGTVTLLWVIPLGMVVGIALGSLGGGGSILTVPALVYLLGLPATAAASGSLIIVGLTSLIGAIPHYRKGNVRLGRGVVFGVLGAAGSYVGARLASGLSAPLLLTAFSILMMVVAILMIRRLRRTAEATRSRDGATHPVRVVLAATAVGLLTGFFGVGGGFAVVPALVLALGLEMRAAVGTSLVVIAINSATALASRIGAGISLDWAVILGFSLFAVAGSLAGAKLTRHVSPRMLTIAFVVMLIGLSVYMAAVNVPALLS